jgi:hypothetical protein
MIDCCLGLARAHMKNIVATTCKECAGDLGNIVIGPDQSGTREILVKGLSLITM